MLSFSDKDRDLRIGMFAQHPSPLQLAWHSFGSNVRVIAALLARRALFASPDDVGTGSEPYKGVRQSLHSSNVVAFEDEQNW